MDRQIYKEGIHTKRAFIWGKARLSEVQALDGVHGVLPAVPPALSLLYQQRVVIVDRLQLLFKQC